MGLLWRSVCSHSPSGKVTCKSSQPRPSSLSVRTKAKILCLQLFLSFNSYQPEVSSTLKWGRQKRVWWSTEGQGKNVDMQLMRRDHQMWVKTTAELLSQEKEAHVLGTEAPREDAGYKMAEADEKKRNSQYGSTLREIRSHNP